jgi:hypothetical protein
VLKQKGVKQTGLKQGLGVFTVLVGSLLTKFCPTSTDFLAALALTQETILLYSPWETKMHTNKTVNWLQQNRNGTQHATDFHSEVS